MRKIECFKTRVLECDNVHLWDIGQQKPIHDILCDHYSFSLNPITIVADPFLIVHEDRLFLFYEMKRNYSSGVICMTSTTDLIYWTKAVVVLEENFHMSYPFVFEDDGSIYMIPETSDIGDVRLYKADDNGLNHFSFCKTLVKKEVLDTEIGYVDSSILKKGDMYYLVTSLERERNNILYLFMSNNLRGPYYNHPSSPICSSPKYGRNGGSFLYDDNGKLYRVAQDCENRYGDNLHLFEIDEITNTSYREHLVKKSIIPTEIMFYKEGGHQLNFLKYKDRIVTVTDAKEYNYYMICRFLHKTISVLKVFSKMLY